MAAAMQSSQNSFGRWLEQRRYGECVAAVEIEPPVFVLGHWRSGTTHLHNLLVVDERFGFPNTYQCLFPNAFLVTERINSPAIGFFLPEHRPMDNVTWTMQSPQEDEFALCLTSLKSPCLGWVFPTRRDYYDRYLTFRGVPVEEIRLWQQALVQFLKRLTFKLRRPLVLKSPTPTCRSKLLLELFPQARFVHIHRDPFTVFRSSKRTFEINFEWQRLQNYSPETLDDWVLRQYETMYDVFFEERELIPRGQYHEVAYEDLEQDPVGEMQRLYENLDLPDFEQVRPALQQYVATLAGYQKNEHQALPDGLRDQISQRWQRCFAEWGYSAS